ncbi:hypothetical protein WHT_c15850 [Bacillus cereus]|nr:hypothetical protein WHT_c15850 [Bacillus cereus]
MIPIKEIIQSKRAFTDTTNEAIVTCNGEQIIKNSIQAPNFHRIGSFFIKKVTMIHPIQATK